MFSSFVEGDEGRPMDQPAILVHSFHWEQGLYGLCHLPKFPLVLRKSQVQFLQEANNVLSDIRYRFGPDLSEIQSWLPPNDGLPC
jgi:hypothetical protein